MTQREIMETQVKELEDRQHKYIIFLFKESPAFKAWIEGTSLFHAIVQDAKNKGEIRVHEPNGAITTIHLNGHQVTKAEDLPTEIIINFYLNSPWFKTDLSKQNLLTDENSGHSI